MSDNTNDKEEFVDLSEKNSEDSVPLDFSYYNVSDHSGIKRIALIIGGCILFTAVLIGTLSEISRRTSKPVDIIIEAPSDSYAGSPFADDTNLIAQSMTENGLYYNEYDNHIRITGFRDMLYPFPMEIPQYINNKPVGEIDYYVFSYSVLKSLTIHDPQCIFFEDGSLPPVDTKVTIIAPAGSKAQEIAEKYGNPFIAE